MIGLTTGLSLLCLIVTVMISVILHVRRKINVQNKNINIPEPSNGIMQLFHRYVCVAACLASSS